MSAEDAYEAPLIQRAAEPNERYALPSTWATAVCEQGCQESWTVDVADFDPRPTLNEIEAWLTPILLDHERQHRAATAYVQGRDVPQHGPMSVTCPRCSAPAGARCRTRVSGRTTDTHEARWAAAYPARLPAPQRTDHVHRYENVGGTVLDLTCSCGDILRSALDASQNAEQVAP